MHWVVHSQIHIERDTGGCYEANGDHPQSPTKEKPRAEGTARGFKSDVGRIPLSHGDVEKESHATITPHDLRERQRKEAAPSARQSPTNAPWCARRAEVVRWCGGAHDTAKKRANSFAPPTTRIATKIAQYASRNNTLRHLRRACSSERRSGFMSRRLGMERAYSESHPAASGWRQPGPSRRALHLWAWLGLIGHFGTETPVAIFTGRERHGRAGEGKWT